MESFLSLIANSTKDLPPENTLFIFPTQRACHEFKKEYIRRKTGPGMLPAVIAIRDLLIRLDVPPVADDVTLLLELHRCQCRLFGHVEMDDFIAYGQQVLDDFNEIDRQDINVQSLFRQIDDLKSLEEQFRHDEEEYEFLKNFWTEFFTGKVIAGIRSSFLQYWRQLPALYAAFKESLLQKNIAYEGMAWRMVADSIPSQAFFRQWDRLIPAGFYAFNEVENRIFKYFKDQGKLILFKDADRLYTANKIHEAGHFFRRGLLGGEDIPWTGNYFEQPRESYAVKGCNGRYSIAREVAHDLYLSITESDSKINKDTVVVLSDESLLFPFLHHCSILNINVNPSMGFPVRHHPLMRIIHLLKKARKTNLHESGRGIQFRFLDDFCNDPLVRSCFPTSEDEEAGEFNAFPPDIREILLNPPVSIRMEKERLLKFMGCFSFGDGEWINSLHQAFLHALLNACRLLEPHEDGLSLNTWWKLVVEDIELTRVPFDSGKDDGIAVMGFLETRLLDFRNIFIAPLNEGILPSGAVSSSLIPYAIRKAYHLPCNEEQQAITAYHFYRLLQRADKIKLYYNTDLNDTGGGEKSRYLLQLHHELITKKKPEKSTYRQQVSRIEAEQSSPLKVVKTREVIAMMRERFSIGEEGEHFKGLSASALNSYIACSLRFYLDHVVYLRPKDKSTGLSAGHFGNVLHKTMEVAYSGIEETNPALYEALYLKISSVIDAAILEVYGKPADSGHDYLMRGVLTQLVRRILEFDEKNGPFRIIGLESKLTSHVETKEHGKIAIKGIIDRIDHHGEAWRILDYKTGAEELGKLKSFDDIFTDSGFKLNLQLFLYALLVNDNFKDRSLPLMTGIFRLRSSAEGITWLNKGETVSQGQLEDFRRGLTNLIEEIFNPEKDFVQTEDHVKCKYCNYQGLCNRRTR